MNIQSQVALTHNNGDVFANLSAVSTFYLLCAQEFICSTTSAYNSFLCCHFVYVLP